MQIKSMWIGLIQFYSERHFDLKRECNLEVPSADEWIRKLWYIYTMEYYSAVKKCFWVSSNEVDETSLLYRVK